MKNLSKFITLTAVLLLPIHLFAAKVHGILRVVKGNVFVISENSTEKKQAKVGQKVYPKDTIITEKDSRVKIVMIDKNEINISPDSKLTIDAYEFDPGKNDKNVTLNVLYGKIRSKVNQKYDGNQTKFEVKTPSAVAGVRGTDFITSFQPTTLETNIITFEGKVLFGIPSKTGDILNAVSVGVGQMAKQVAQESPKPPVAISNNDLKQLDVASDAEKASTKDEVRIPAEEPQPTKKNEPGKKEGSENKVPNEEKGSKDRAPSSMIKPEDEGQKAINNNDGNNPGPRPVGPGSMLTNEDTPLSKEPIMVPLPGQNLNSGYIPPPTYVNPVPICESCKDLIEGRSNVIIRVIKK